MIVGKAFLVIILLAAGAVSLEAKSPADAPVAIVNVNVIPMDRERVLANQTVIVRNGIISAIGDSRRISVPKGARRIEGRNKFLIPGLMDMHVHLMSDEDEFPNALAKDELTLMVANGPTRIRLMTGTPEQLVLRARAARGEIISPTIYAASPQFIGKKSNNAYVVTNESEARESVRQAKRDGYDFLKITTNVKAEVYEAIVDEAAKQNIRVIGHADSRSVGLARALKAGQQIEHLDSYLEALLPDNAPIKGSVSDIYLYNPKNWESIDYLDESKIPEIAKATVASNPFCTPTLTLFKYTFGIGRTEESIRAQPDARFYPPKVMDFWLGVTKRYWWTVGAAPQSAERHARYVEIRNKIVRAIHAAGGKIMAGSDSPEWILLYGFSLHRELKTLNEAGLSTFTVLSAATRNPAEFFGTLKDTGTIEIGKRADLVLLDATPLKNISNTENRSGVMLNGRYFTQAEMNRWLDEIAPKFQA